MNLYLLTQTENKGYDTYSACVVAAESEDAARLIHPDGYTDLVERYSGSTWATRPERVTVSLIGIAVTGTKDGVICASFHAG